MKKQKKATDSKQAAEKKKKKMKRVVDSKLKKIKAGHRGWSCNAPSCVGCRNWV